MKKLYFISAVLAIVGLSCSDSTVADKKMANKIVQVAEVAGANDKPIEVVGKEIAPGVIELPRNQVCMVNDVVKPAEQIPVVVNSKTYYGCCQACVDALKAKEFVRSATDLLTGENVDKSSAIVVLKPRSKDEVLYFASEANAIKYIERDASLSPFLKSLQEQEDTIHLMKDLNF